LQTSTANGSSGFLPINQTNNNHNHNHNNNNNNNANEHIPDGLQSIPSPPITVSGSDMSSPGAPNGSSSPQITTRPTPVKSPFEWMKKPSYQSQPNPGFWRGHPDQQPDATRPRKTRTKDKYRVVYTDHQRLELEKEFHYTRYITIRRKSELAQALALSERQVKIWFQNRRAKDRKQKKKMENGSSLSSNGQSLLSGSHGNNNTSSNLSGLLDVKPKMEPSLHLQHLHHQMGAIGIGMSQMGLHHPHHPLHSHHLAPPPPLPPTSMNQTSTAQQGSAGSTASSLLLG
jgi:homeobox protein CDX